MSSSPKLKQISYSDAARLLCDHDVQDDITDAFTRLAQAMGTTMDRFEAIAKQMHSIDMRLRTSFRSKWESLRKDIADLLWQLRTNSAVISGRLKLFCSTVLPLAARNVDRQSMARSRGNVESIQVLQSFTSLSSEHAAATRSLVDRTARLGGLLIAFFVDLLRATTSHNPNAHRPSGGGGGAGVEEMVKVSQKITEFEMGIRKVFTSTADLPQPNIIHLLYVCSRFVASSGRPSRSKIRKPIVLENDLADLAQAYDNFDRKRNDLAHAQYTAQLRQNRADPLTLIQNQLFAFIQELVLTTESGLTLSLAVWARLRADCGALFQWIGAGGPSPAGQQGPLMTAQNQMSTPPVVVAFLEGGYNVYMPIARGMDAFVATIDPALYANDNNRGD